VTCCPAVAKATFPGSARPRSSAFPRASSRRSRHPSCAGPCAPVEVHLGGDRRREYAAGPDRGARHDEKRQGCVTPAVLRVAVPQQHLINGSARRSSGEEDPSRGCVFGQSRCTWTTGTGLLRAAHRRSAGGLFALTSSLRTGRHRGALGRSSWRQPSGAALDSLGATSQPCDEAGALLRVLVCNSGSFHERNARWRGAHPQHQRCSRRRVARKENFPSRIR
jgi:hypothetical protein